ncbi:MAG: cell envelope integrity protein TolA [Winogradskyella sp.]|nr:MAG: cell envelope integrity protein TolA [Winogradskyella sp.]
MKYLKTKHERNSAKITGLTVLIIALLMFVVGAPYKEIPEEYGVAINFGEPSVVNNKMTPDNPTKSEEVIEDVQEETDAEEQVEEEPVEEELVQETTEEEPNEEEKAEEEAAEKAAEDAAKEKAAEELLAQEEAEALKLQAEKEAKEKAEAKKAAEEKAKAERDAKAKADAEAKKAAKAKAEKEAREAKERAAKATAVKAAAAKAEADRKAAAAAAAEKNKNGGSTTSGFKLSQEGAIYPGCEDKDNKARKDCMSQKVAQFVDANFDKTIASDLGFTGNQKITIYFKINKTGKIFDIRARAADPKLVAEAVRVTKMLPKLKPALQQGKPIVVPFSASIRFAEQ